MGFSILSGSEECLDNQRASRLQSVLDPFHIFGTTDVGEENQVVAVLAEIEE